MRLLENPTTKIKTHPPVSFPMFTVLKRNKSIGQQERSGTGREANGRRQPAFPRGKEEEETCGGLLVERGERRKRKSREGQLKH